jgi:hypothetical protein
VPLPDVLERLLTAPGPSGYESAPAVFAQACRAFSGDVSIDVVGSAVVRVPGTTSNTLRALAEARQPDTQSGRRPGGPTAFWAAALDHLQRR